jgi:hypothetical protein
MVLNPRDILSSWGERTRNATPSALELTRAPDGSIWLRDNNLRCGRSCGIQSPTPSSLSARCLSKLSDFLDLVRRTALRTFLSSGCPTSSQDCSAKQTTPLYPAPIIQKRDTRPAASVQQTASRAAAQKSHASPLVTATSS